MIKLNGISKTYKSINGKDYRALKNINLTLNDTGMIFIIGKSGSGKTTLLNILGGLDRQDEGYLTINGKSTEDFSEKDYDSYRNSNVGFIFQEFNLIESLNVEENIYFSAQILGKQINVDATDKLLKLVGLEGLNQRKINELSGGQRQRVAIARILNKECDYIFADEPTGNLDTKVGKQIFDLLKKLSKNKLVVIVSHDRENAKKYADRIIEIKNGEVVNDVTRNKKVPEKDLYINEKKELFLPTNRALKEKEIQELNTLLKKNITKIKSSPKKFHKTKLLNEEETKVFINKKSKMSFKNALKFALSNIKVKISRFITVIMILVIALTLLGFSSFFSDFDGSEATINTFNENGIERLVINQGRYKEKIKQLEHKKTVFTNDNLIQEFKEEIGDNYLESKSILINRPKENTLSQSLTDIENGYHLDDVSDLEKVGFKLLSGEYKKNNKTQGYVNLLITDVTWYIHTSVDSNFLTQTLSSNTVTTFKNMMNEDILSLDDDSHKLLTDLLSKIDGTNGTISELTNIEKIQIFNMFKNSNNLMGFVFKYFENNFSWNSSNVLYRITGIVDTGIGEKEKSLLDSIILKNDTSILTNEEEVMINKCYMYYNKVYGDFSTISGIRQVSIYSRSGSKISLSNNINSNSVYPTGYLLLSYEHYYKYDSTTFFIGANAGKDLKLRNGYELGSISDRNNYNILSPEEEIFQRPQIDIPTLKKTQIRPSIPGISFRKSGLQNNDIILDKDIFSSIFGIQAIDKYFVSENNEDKNTDLIIYLQLAKDATPIEFRVVGIANGGGVAMMMGNESLNTIMLHNNIVDSYLFGLTNNHADNVKMLNLLEKHNSYHVSEISKIMYDIISIFKVFELVFMALTIILIILTIILISNFINTSITRKTREIGLLRAMGVSNRNVNKIFLYESLLIGVIAAGLSILLNILSMYPINELLLLSLPQFFGTELNIEISLLSFNIWIIPTITTISVLTCVFSTIIPAHRIGKIKPADSMRAINK